MHASAGFFERAKKASLRRIALFTGSILLLIGALMTAAIVKTNKDALARGRLEASYLSSALEEDVEGSLNTIACAFGFVKQRIEFGDGSNFLPQLTRQIAKNAPALIAISIIGPDGRLRETSGDADLKAIDFSEFDFFRSQKENPGAAFAIYTPVTIAQRALIPAAGRLDAKDGAFAGTVLFSLDPRIGASTFNRLDLGKTGSIKIAGLSGILFAGYTLPGGRDSSLAGTIAATGEARTHWHFGASGSYIAKSPRDGVERIYSWRKIRGFPLVAVVGLGKAEALEGADREAVLVTSLAILSAALLLGMAQMLRREFSRRGRFVSTLDAHRRRLQEMNAKLEIAKREAEEANLSKSMFLANIGHELRTPLNAILGFAEIIRDRLLGDDQGRYSRYAADIYQAGTHLLNVIRSILDLSKIEAGEFEIHEAVLDVDAALEESRRFVKAQADKRGVTLNTAQQTSGIKLYADETVLKQIVTNLLSNAIKFTSEGGSVILSASLDANGSFDLTVKDTGIGMTEEEIREALEPYRRVRSEMSADSEGTGLGLPLALRLTELHGGTLSVASTRGGGTSVTAQFPAWRVSPGDDRTAFEVSHGAFNAG